MTLGYSPWYDLAISFGKHIIYEETHSHVEAHSPLHALHHQHARHRRLWKVAQLDNSSKRRYETMLQLTLRYTRYILSTLATVGFGIALN